MDPEGNTIDRECTGSIVSRRAILTSAFCIKDKTYTTMVHTTIVYGTNDKDDHRMSLTTDKWISHPDYSFYRPSPAYDVGLLITEEELEFSLNVGPICLPSERLQVSIDYQVQIQ